MQKPVPASYGRASYYAEHAFKFTAADGTSRNSAPIDDLVVDDFVRTTGGVDVASKVKFKEWASALKATITDLQFEVIETFQNEDRSLSYLNMADYREEQRDTRYCGGPATYFIYRHSSLGSARRWKALS